MGLTEKTHKDKVCNVCGHEGFYEELITCLQCKKATEHFYCTARYPNTVFKAWVCEACAEENEQPIQLPSKNAPFKTKESAKVNFVSAEAVASLVLGSKAPASSMKEWLGELDPRNGDVCKMASVTSKNTSPRPTLTTELEGYLEKKTSHACVTIPRGFCSLGVDDATSHPPLKCISKSFIVKSEDISARPQPISKTTKCTGSDSGHDLQVPFLHMNNQLLTASDKTLVTLQGSYTLHPSQRACPAVAKPTEHIKPVESEEQVYLHEKSDAGEELLEEGVEYEELEEIEEYVEEVEEVEEEVEYKEIVEVAEEESTVANAEDAETTTVGDSEMKDSEKEEDDNEKHETLLALPPHGSEVYIDNIPQDVSEDDLKSFVETIGEVVEVRKDSAKNKGHALITFRTKELACKAIEALNNKKFKGRKVKVSNSHANNKLFIGNLPRDWAEEDLKKEVMKIGPGVILVKLIKDPKHSCRNRGFAFIEFHNYACAEFSRKKISAPQFKLGGNAPSVSWAERKRHGSYSSQVKALYIRNLPKNATQGQVKELFKHHGQIAKVILHPAKSGEENRCGHVHFAERSMAIKALGKTYKLDGHLTALWLFLFSFWMAAFFGCSPALTYDVRLPLDRPSSSMLACQTSC